MIFPKTQHLKITMYASSLSGTWPFIFENNPKLRKLYNIYSNIVFSCYLFYTISAIIKLFMFITDDVLNISEIAVNLGITLITSVTILRLRAINSNGIQNIMRKVIIFEEKILKCTNEKIMRIYKSHVKQSQIASVIFIVEIIFSYISLIVFPLTVPNTIIFNAATNNTVIIKPLPLSTWLPIDEQKYYFCAYAWYSINCLSSVLFVTAVNTYVFSLIVFFLGQIRVLKQILTDFQENVMKVKNQLQCTRDEASFVTMRECILKHKEINQYVQQYNDEMRTVMLLDFLQSSIQLASIMVNLFMTQKNGFDLGWYGTFIHLSYTLSINYWYANEITEHSTEIDSALYDSKWYEEPIKVQKLMVVIMLRCNKPLYLEIGKFSTMTLSTFIGIIKATYSYMMLVYNNN